MTDIETLQTVQYMTIKGKRFAVVALEEWESLLERLVTLEDVEVAKRIFAKLKETNGGSKKADWLEWGNVSASEASLRPENRHALKVLRDWMAEPDDLGDDWWDAFEQELEENRFSIRRG